MAYQGSGSSYINCGNASDVQLTGDFSVLFWVYIPTTGTATILSRVTQDADGKSIQLYHNATNVIGHVSTNGTAWGNDVSVAYTASTWEHWAFVYDGTNLKLSKNAGSFTSVAQSGTLHEDGHALWVAGKYSDDYNYYFGNGDRIQEVKIWKGTALTLAQIAQEKERKGWSLDTNLVLYLPLDHSTDIATYPDYTQGGNDGSRVGSPTVGDGPPVSGSASI